MSLANSFPAHLQPVDPIYELNPQTVEALEGLDEEGDPSRDFKSIWDSLLPTLDLRPPGSDEDDSVSSDGGHDSLFGTSADDRDDEPFHDRVENIEHGAGMHIENTFMANLNAYHLTPNSPNLDVKHGFHVPTLKEEPQEATLDLYTPTARQFAALPHLESFIALSGDVIVPGSDITLATTDAEDVEGGEDEETPIYVDDIGERWYGRVDEIRSNTKDVDQEGNPTVWLMVHWYCSKDFITARLKKNEWKRSHLAFDHSALGQNELVDTPDYRDIQPSRCIEGLAVIHHFTKPDEKDVNKAALGPDDVFTKITHFLHPPPGATQPEPHNTCICNKKTKKRKKSSGPVRIKSDMLFCPEEICMRWQHVACLKAGNYRLTPGRTNEDVNAQRVTQVPGSFDLEQFLGSIQVAMDPTSATPDTVRRTLLPLAERVIRRDANNPFGNAREVLAARSVLKYLNGVGSNWRALAGWDEIATWELEIRTRPGGPGKTAKDDLGYTCALCLNAL